MPQVIKPKPIRNSEVQECDARDDEQDYKTGSRKIKTLNKTKQQIK
jgi:hypothetical protein